MQLDETNNAEIEKLRKKQGNVTPKMSSSDAKNNNNMLYLFWEP